MYTGDQRVPFQCTAALPATAQQLAAEAQATPFRPPTFGVLTLDHLVPVQRKASVPLTCLGGTLAQSPTAQQLVFDPQRIPLSCLM